VKEEKTIVIHGVPLETMKHPRVSSGARKIVESVTVAGERQIVDTGVKIDLATGTVSLAGPRWWLSE
jgi:hypothetical protein